jgi:voltage-gated potassium channel
MGTSQKLGFPILFASLIALLLLPPYLEAAGVQGITRILLSSVLLSSLYLVATSQRQLIIGALLAIPTLGLNWTRELLWLPDQLYILNLLHLVFFAYVSIVMLRYIFSTQRVTIDMIFAALCTYLIIGLAWIFIYSCIELRLPGSFSSITANDYQAQMHDFLYYSFVTLSTLGYGDVTPLNNFAKPWAIIESIIGQFYLAVILARLVGLQITARNFSHAKGAGTTN